MEIIKDIGKESELIKTAIKTNGHLAQHHYDLYINYADAKEERVFFDFGKEKGILAYCEKDIWHFLTEPLAPSDEKKIILFDSFKWIFRNGGKKVILEDITEDFRREILTGLKEYPWRAVRPSYYLIWPIFDLLNWTGEGKKWKRLRNLKNKFFRDNEVRIKTPQNQSKEKLINLIYKWKSQRNDNDRVYLSTYLRFIENEFNGCDLVRIFEIKGEPVSISAGWPVPNNRGLYYSCIGIYDYDFRNIGEAAYWDELVELKKLGYRQVDLGGSYGGLLQFKQKFHPVSLYKTYTFSVFKE